MKLNLSKSQYVRGLKCPLSLWFYKNRRDIERVTSDKSQQIMSGGQEVGELAQKLYPEGVLISEDYTQIDEAIVSTQEAIKSGATVLFEATAATPEGDYSRIDIFKKVPKTDEWDMIEVKCSTEVKDYHIDDVSFQRHVFEEAGYKIRKSILMHINNKYLRQGKLDLNQLFTQKDLTEEAKSRKAQVTSNIENINNIIAGKEPKTKIGKQCGKYYECDYNHHCWAHLPEYSVFNIGRFSKKWDCYNKGIIKVEDIYDHYDLLNPKQLIEVESYKNNQVHIEKDKIREFLDQLEYPLYYLDYETTSHVIPPYDKTCPYQQIPFQFSLHIQKEKDAELEHVEFLHQENNDPRPAMIHKLIESCGKSGSVIVYNIVFERSHVNEKLIQQFPEYEAEISSINERMIDLLVPFSNRFIYHPAMKGSASIKSVLPAFVPELSYKDLEIQDGGMAPQEYLRALMPETSQEERKKIFNNLKLYCGLDTMAMVELIEVLKMTKINKLLETLEPINEMARIGYTGYKNDLEMRVYDEPLKNPSFHLLSKSKGYEVVLTIRELKILEWKTKGTIKDNKVPKIDLKAVVEFFKKKHVTLDTNNWEYLRAVWIDHNPNLKKQLEDIMPDYDSLI